VEQHAEAVVLEAAEPVSGARDLLDAQVQAFGQAVARAGRTFGEAFRTGQQQLADLAERIVLAATMTERLVLHAATTAFMTMAGPLTRAGDGRATSLPTLRREEPLSDGIRTGVQVRSQTA
jgi:hypothetical protein